MNTVQPIRDKANIEKMGSLLMDNGKLKEYALLKVGLNTGLRISDILLLKWEVLADKENKIVIDLKEKKTGKTKRITINGNAQKALNMLRKANPNDTYVFQSQSNNSKNKIKPWSRVYAYNFLNDIASKIGITEKIGTHSLRKSFGYHAYKSGKSLQLLQKIFKHSSPAITLEYIGITQDDIDDVYLNINL